MFFRHAFYQIIGRFTALIAGAISAPIYMLYLGAESYGIVGIYLTFFAFLSLFDFGLPVSINRQISRMCSQQKSQKEILSVVRSYELVIFSIAAFGALLLVFAAPYLSVDWLNNAEISNEVIEIALILAAIAAAMRFPIAFYNNVLFASERHFIANLVTTLFAVTRVVITVLLLEYYKNNLMTFFLAQIALNLLELFICFVVVWRRDASCFLLRPNWQVFRNNLSLTVSLTGVSVTALLQSQVDKILLSKWLSLSEFGVYSLAYSLAMGVLPVAYAIGNAAFPKITRLIEKADIKQLKDLLLKANSLILLLIMPAALCVAFSPQLLKLFVALFTDQHTLLASLLFYMLLGACFQAGVVLPHQYRVAQHKASYIFCINFLCIPIYITLLYVLINKYGSWGGAQAFLIINMVNCGLHYLSFFQKGDRNIWKQVMLKYLILICLGLSTYCIALWINVESFSGFILQAFLIYVITFGVLFLLNKEFLTHRA